MLTKLPSEVYKITTPSICIWVLVVHHRLPESICWELIGFEEGRALCFLQDGDDANQSTPK